MGLFPYCYAASAGDGNDYGWDCFRGVTLGLFNLGAFVYCAYASSRIARMCYRTRGWYALNLLMLMLASVQCLLTGVKYTFVKEQRLSFAAAYLRGLQSLLTCLFYGRAAAETLGSKRAYYRWLVPLLAILTLYLSILFLVALSLDEIPCHHTTWLLMSGSQMFITVVFAISGIFVMRDLYYAPGSIIRRDYTEAIDGEQFEVKLQRTALKVLLFFNALGATLQLVLDSWLQHKFRVTGECHFLDTPEEELLRLTLKLFSYDVPVIATIYVFYYLPRRQFDTELEVTLDESVRLDTIEDELLRNW